MKKYWWWLTAGAGMAAVFAGGMLMAMQFEHGAPAISDARVAGEEGKQLPLFRGVNFEGEAVESSVFAGKPMIVYLWATWHPLCVKELQDLAVIQREFADQVQIVAINRAEPRETARQFTDELGVTDELVFWLDETDSYYQGLGGLGMPETLFVASDGVVRLHQRGTLTQDEIREAVLRLLEGH